MSTEKRAPLDRKRVADTALKLLNEVGLDGLSLRAIAKELDVKAPALYWHFKDKQALLDEMATEMYRRMVAGAALDPGDSWQERLLKSNRGLRAALLAYRDGAKVFSGSRFTGIDHAREMEENLRLFTAIGFTLAQTVRASSTAYAYTIGFVTEEQGVRPCPANAARGTTSGNEPACWPTSPSRPRPGRRSSRTMTGTSRKVWRWSSRGSRRATAAPERRVGVR